MIQSANTNKELTFEDKEYLQKEIKGLIKGGKTVLEILEKDLKIGTKSGMFEAYAKLLDSVTTSLKELRILNKMILDVEFLTNADTDSKGSTTLQIQMTGRELIDMINSAKENSQINALSADFEEISEENIK